MQKEQYKFKTLTNRNGLSQNTVNTIIQDSDGFLWFGTQDGLNRYDGETFKIYKKNINNPYSISENFISTLFEDKDGKLWIGTYNSGLSMYDKYYDRFENLDPLKFLENEYITSIADDNESNLWIGTFHSGLFKFSKRDHKIEKIHLDNFFSEKDYLRGNISDICFDETEKKIYVGVWNYGLYELESIGNEIKLLNNNDTKNNKNICTEIFSLCIDTERNIWVGTKKGLYKYHNHEFECMNNFIYTTPENKKLSVKIIKEDKNGNLWIGTYTSGLYKFEINSRKFTNFKTETNNQTGYSCNTVFSIYFDKTEILWVGTLAEGLMKVDTLQKKFFSIENKNEIYDSAIRNKVRSIHASHRNKLVIGTFEDGMYIYINENEILSYQKYSNLNRNVIYSIFKDINDNYWISHSDLGLCRVNFKENSFTNFFKEIFNEQDNGIFTISNIKGDSDLLILGTEKEGIKIWDSKNNTVFLDNLSDELNHCEIKSIFTDSKNNIWIATHLKGLLALENMLISREFISKPILRRFNCGNTVYCVHESKNNEIWVGTASNGLNRINIEDNSVEIFNEDYGLANNCVHGIFEDENNNLWMSTNNGISKFETKDKIFKNYDLTDGLNNNEFNGGAYFKDSEGYIYFGGNDGITYFKPEEIKDNPHVPKIVITDFELFNRTVIGSSDNPYLKKNITFADEINLTYKQSVFSFKFAALIFNNPQKNQYAYKMEGFDKDWTFCGSRNRATYTNLNPGEYIFKVKGSNNDGIWNEEYTSIKINISPPYWKTWWFKSLGFLAFTAATGLSYKQRLKKIEKEKNDQEEFARKLIESQEKERKRIAHELHDTIAHDILISKNKAAMALKHKDNIGKMEESLREISELASSTINDVRHIAYNLHPHQLEKLGFRKTIHSIINEADKSTNITFSWDIDEIDNLISKEISINLFRVIQELINNIIKHSGAKKANIQIKKIHKYIFAYIADNGKGFDYSRANYHESEGGIGLSGIIERIKFMGEYKLESNINAGTVYKIKIPLNNKQDDRIKKN